MERSNKFQNVLIVMLTVAVVAMAVGFATYTANLQINGNATFSAAKWDVHFENYQTTANSNATVTSANITTSDTKVEFNVSLDPGEVYEFTVDAVNKGTFDAKLSSVTINPAPASTYGTGYYTYEVWYNGTACTDASCTAAINSTLAKENGTATVKVKVAYPILEQTALGQYPAVATTNQYTVALNYVDAATN